MAEDIRLTQLSHKGGCGCKLSPAVLSSLLTNTANMLFPKELLVGRENSDDAAVYKVNEDQAIIATTDFFMPIVDDPIDFGKIAACNAISDIYAMGGHPLFALAIVGMPLQKISSEVVRKILMGGESICSQAGIPIAGGHSIDSLEPIYGLCVIGLIHPKNIKKNTGAKPKDKIVLGKPLGVGIYCSALKKNGLDTKSYQELLTLMTSLNTPGIALSKINEVHALTDVTGFGLLGHLLEICRGSKVNAQLDLNNIPFLDKAMELVEKGYITGASTSNWNSYSSYIRRNETLSLYHQHILTDPQTSGGLLLTCSEEGLDRVLDCFYEKKFSPKIIGEISEGSGEIVIL